MKSKEIFYLLALNHYVNRNESTLNIACNYYDEANIENDCCMYDVDCNGGSTGSITISGMDGTSPYNYSIDGGATWQVVGTFTGLSQGSYIIDIEDFNLCTYTTSSIVVTEPLALSSSSPIFRSVANTDVIVV